MVNLEKFDAANTGKMCLVVSYPKSGRTWLRVMLAELGIDAQYTHLDAGGRGQFGKRVDDLTIPNRKDERIVFLHRDPRDTVVSFFHQMTKRQRFRFREKLGMGLTGRLPPHDINAFVRSSRYGIEKTIVFNLQCAAHLDAHVVSYEAMRESPAEELMRLLVGIGFPGQRDRVVQVVEENSFAKMREREANGFYKTGILRPGNPADPDSFKVRKGKVGGWREEMDDDTQAFSEEILARYDYFDRMRKLTERRGKRESLSGQFREQ